MQRLLLGVVFLFAVTACDNSSETTPDENTPASTPTSLEEEAAALHLPPAQLKATLDRMEGGSR